MLLIRKLLGFVLTTLLTGLFLSFLLVVTGEAESFLVLSLLLTGAFPFVLLVGVPVSCLSDYLTKNVNGKQRNKKALFIHAISGLTAGLVLAFFFEGLAILGMTLIAALIFWLVDEGLRKKKKRCKILTA